MICIMTKDIDYAEKLYREIRPESSELSVRRFRVKAESHLSKDYSGSRLLRLEGLEGCPCHPTIEVVDYDSERFGTEVNYAVIVNDGHGGVRFDSDELLMYNAFTRDPAGVESRKKEIKNKSLGAKS